MGLLPAAAGSVKTTVRHVAADLAAFERIAARFAATLRAGDVVALEGELGAGKTTFVAAVARALGAADEVASPTFIFRHRYAGSPPIEHLDLYRIDDPAEAVELGLDEALGGDAIAFVEWPERLPGFVPADALRVRIAGSGSSARTLDISGH
jgi:tRNA threonylcarbamoyladenosine biosynthesis protein TsaE